MSLSDPCPTVPAVTEPATILDRMTAAGIDEDRARAHLAAGTVRVAGHVVTDPEQACPTPTAWVIGPG